MPQHDLDDASVVDDGFVLEGQQCKLNGCFLSHGFLVLHGRMETIRVCSCNSGKACS